MNGFGNMMLMSQMRRWQPIILAGVAILSGIVFFSCQSPYENPPEVKRSVVIRVVDSTQVPISSIPVEVFRGTSTAGDPLTGAVTDQIGLVLFRLPIPQTGGAYTFLAGTSRTGKVTVTANLLCRDTLLLVMLGGVTLPCGSSGQDTVLFTDVCARTATGVEFPDSVQRQFCSSCDVPLTMSIPPVRTSDRLVMKIFDQNGVEAPSGSFILPPRGCFVVRFVYTPQQPGVLRQDVLLTGSGAGNATMSLLLAVRGNAIACNQCLCGDPLTILVFPNTVVAPPDSSSFISRTVNQNRTPCTRTDKLIKNFTSGSGFRLENEVLGTIRPNEGQPVQVRFTPTRTGSFEDTLIFETTYRENGLVCRHLVIVRATGVQPQCCLDVASSSPGLVVGGGAPRVDTLRLKTRTDESVSGLICFRNCGSGGWITISAQLAMPTSPGFSVTPDRLHLGFPSTPGCFTVAFRADGSIVRPNGPGGPVKIRHETDLNIFGCEPRNVHLVVDIDTLPLLFSNCIYRWSQNLFNGYNFTPPETKGAFIVDVNGNNSGMSTDFTLMSIAGTTANVRVRSGWKLIRTGVSDQNDFTYAAVQQYPNFGGIKMEPFNTQQDVTMALFSVYSIRVQRGTVLLYALVRVREISTDGQKDKICLDVLFPM